MPVYKYITIEADGSDGEVFEVEQPMSAMPLEKHPESGKRARRIFEAPNICDEYTPGKEKSLSDMSRIKRAGFGVLEKDKLTGKYFKR